jgi:signal peptidase I
MPDTQTGRPEEVDQYGNVRKQGIPGPVVFYGDRILVLKYLYLLAQPRRWDVVVFKPPTQLSQNFIKRLIGKPGEAVLILDGDIWIRPADAKDPADFSIATKPADVQPAMWRLVYDNDYHPHLKDEYRAPVAPWTQPWKTEEGTGWNMTDPATDGRALLFENTAGNSTLRFDPNANITAQTTSDYLVHDQSSPGMPPREGAHEKDIPVSDLDLRVTYQRASGAGPLELKLTKRDHRFRAVVLPGSVSLFDDCQGKSTQVGATFTLAAGTDPVRIELSNADYHAALRINDKVVAETTPQTYAPDLKKLLAEYDTDVSSGTVSSAPPGIAEITAGGQACRLTHVSLWRDLYYYNRDVSVLQGVRWGTPRDFPKDVQQLGPDEYFTMGDNSLVSFDARIWPTGLDLPEEDLRVAAGRVPGRFLLGKAFYVYWPAGHSINPSLPALVPNFGSMRFIH